MLVRLAHETRGRHAGADADRLALLDEPTHERYRSFLETVYALESRYEDRLIQTPELDPRVVRAHAKADRLCADLLALGATEAELAASPRAPVPAFRSAAQAMGWLYVVERNTLLHGLLRRHLWRTIPSTIERAGAYLSAYTLPGMHYRDLGADLDEAARRAIPSEIVAAAHAAFACQRLWFARGRQSSAASASAGISGTSSRSVTSSLRRQTSQRT